MVLNNFHNLAAVLTIVPTKAVQWAILLSDFQALHQKAVAQVSRRTWRFSSC